MDRATLPDGPASVRGLSVLGDSLAGVGYRVDELRAVLGVESELSIAPADQIVYGMRIASRPGPLAAVIALLALGRPVSRERIRAALGADAVGILLESGAVCHSDEDLVACLRITPHGDFVIASDALPDRGTPSDPSYVTGINAPATLLATLTPRSDVGSALDLGTGNGIQALLASRHCDRVVATDVNPRAIAYARFNAALNGIDSIEFHQGSWFDAVDGATFDLIVSNPPYVISPDNELIYRDSGAEPGELCSALLEQTPRHLTEGGIAVVLVSWPITTPEWAAVPRTWVPADCRAWLVQMHADDPVDHARTWNLPLVVTDGLDGYERAVVRWADYTRTRGIVAIGYGAMAVVRRSGRSGIIRADAVRTATGRAGTHVARVLRNDDVDVGDAATAVFRLAPGVHLQRDAVPVSDGWSDGAARLVVTDGLPVDIDFDPLMARVLIVATSGLTVDEAARHVAMSTGLDPGRHDDLVAAAGAMLSELHSLGLAELITVEGAP